MMRNNIIRQGKLLYSTSKKVQSLAKKISQSRIYFQITKAKIKKQSSQDKNGPFNLVIETTNFCNASCIMCPYRLMKRPKKIMAQKTFNKIIARIKEEKLPINKVFFSGLGEPLTDPDLVARMAAVKHLGFPVKLYTNASLLTPEISGQIVTLAIDEINISFNAATPEQYQKVMGLDFYKTTKNINTLLKTKRKQGGRLPVIQISLIITSENEKDIKKHLQNWSAKVDSVTVSRPHEWGGAIIHNSKFIIHNSDLTYPCRSLWHTLNIDSAGNFVICCRDYESRQVLGNIMTHSFADIQKSPILKSFRRLHLNYSQKKLPRMCQKCNFPYQKGVEWYFPRHLD